jgi:hypothetical protein
MLKYAIIIFIINTITRKSEYLYLQYYNKQMSMLTALTLEEYMYFTMLLCFKLALNNSLKYYLDNQTIIHFDN